jgi:hypothetical protein
MGHAAISFTAYHVLYIMFSSAWFIELLGIQIACLKQIRRTIKMLCSFLQTINFVINFFALLHVDYKGSAES